MIHLDDRHRLHQFLMLELAIRYLKMDVDIFRTAKCSNVFVPFAENLLKDLLKQYNYEKQYFSNKKIRPLKWEKAGNHFSQVTVATAGEDAIFKYANQAVKTHVEDILKIKIETYLLH